MATNYERGRQYEYKSMRLLEAMGYETARAAGSRGCWDVAGFCTGGVVLVQVKYRCDPSATELEQFALYPCPSNVQKIIHRWDYRKSTPRVTVVDRVGKEPA